MSQNNHPLFRHLRKKIVCLILLINTSIVLAQLPGKIDAIYSGTPWFDQNGKEVSAHGANIIKDKGRFYLFGEVHGDTNNAFAVFNC